MRIWFDITNTPQVHFLLSIQEGLKSLGMDNFILSARDFSETIKFLEQKTDYPIIKIGGHAGRNLNRKAIGLLDRFRSIHKNINEYDFSISCGSEAAIWSAFLKKKISIAFGDNDLARQWTYSVFVNHAFFPVCIPSQILYKQGLKASKLYQYNGFKEHVYIADYVPDKKFLESLPFKNYVVVRPENIQANYLNNVNSGSITPVLLKKLSDIKSNILYLPRYQSDREYAWGIKSVHVPDGPVNGLDACYFSDAVFTGAGTFAREAACLGVPSFSFFAGNHLLAVDNAMLKTGKMFYSRDPDKLIEKYITSGKNMPDIGKAQIVKNEVISKLYEIIRRIS